MPLELVDKYCKETNSKAPLEKVIKDVALTHVDGYMKVPSSNNITIIV